MKIKIQNCQRVKIFCPKSYLISPIQWTQTGQTERVEKTDLGLKKHLLNQSSITHSKMTNMDLQKAHYITAVKVLQLIGYLVMDWSKQLPQDTLSAKISMLSADNYPLNALLEVITIWFIIAICNVTWDFLEKKKGLKYLTCLVVKAGSQEAEYALES